MSDLRIVRGNTFWTLTEVTAIDANGLPIVDFDLAECTDIEVLQTRSYVKAKAPSFSVLEGNILQVMWYGPAMTSATKYGLEVTGKYNGVDWRFANYDVLQIVHTNAEANIPEGAFVSDGFFRIEPSELIILTSIPQVQADWNESDTKSPAYIKNKPMIPTFIDDVTVVGSNLVFVFRTTSGEQTITVPLSSIFDQSLYYDKEQINAIVNGVLGQVDTLLANSVFYETLYKGVWHEGEYGAGSMVKYGGSLYVAKTDTSNCPVNQDGSINADWE